MSPPLVGEAIMFQGSMFQITDVMNDPAQVLIRRDVIVSLEQFSNECTPVVWKDMKGYTRVGGLTTT